MNTPIKIIKPTIDTYPLNDVTIKDEFANTYGTLKDRRNNFILREATRLKVDKLVLITSGNNGYSLAKLAKEHGNNIKVVAIIDSSLNSDIVSLLENSCYQVIKINLKKKFLRPEEVIAFSRESDHEVIWDVTNGYEAAYKAIMKEILTQQKEAPDYIVIPFGSGSIFSGIAEEIINKNLKTKIIGIGPVNKKKSFADKLYTPWTPYKKLVNEYLGHGHKLYRVGEKEIKNTYEQWKDIVDCEPSSSIVFNAPHLHKFKKDDTIIFLNSGKLKM